MAENQRILNMLIRHILQKIPTMQYGYHPINNFLQMPKEFKLAVSIFLLDFHLDRITIKLLSLLHLISVHL